jgi:predicted peptidase
MQTASQWNNMNYLVYLPDHYQKAQEPLPLIIFLHGRGERGTDVTLVAKHGLPALLEEEYWSPSADIEAAEAEVKWTDYGAVQPNAPKEPVDPVADEIAGIVSFPFIVLSPQCPSDHLWADYIDETIALIDHFIATYNVNPNRVYLTGFSMGGHGTLVIGGTHPDRFAALWSVAAPTWEGITTEFAPVACNLKGKPIWLMHGAKDEGVPVEHMYRFNDILNECGIDARMTVYPDAGHTGAAYQAYSEQEVYTWLLSHTLNP